MRSGKDFNDGFVSEWVFGQRLRAVLAHDNITHDALADMAKVSRPSIQRLLAGGSPSLRVAIKIAKSLDVSLDWLCGLEDEE